MMEYQPVYRYNKRSRSVYNIEGEQMFDAVSFFAVFLTDEMLKVVFQ